MLHVPETLGRNRVSKEEWASQMREWNHQGQCHTAGRHSPGAEAGQVYWEQASEGATAHTRPHENASAAAESAPAITCE